MKSTVSTGHTNAGDKHHPPANGKPIRHGGASCLPNVPFFPICAIFPLSKEPARIGVPGHHGIRPVSERGLVHLGIAHEEV